MTNFEFIKKLTIEQMAMELALFLKDYEKIEKDEDIVAFSKLIFKIIKFLESERKEND